MSAWAMHMQATSVALLWLTLRQTFCDLHVSATVNFPVFLWSQHLLTYIKHTSSTIWRAKTHPLETSFQLNSTMLDVCFGITLYLWINIFPQLFNAKKSSCITCICIFFVCVWISCPGFFLVWDEGLVKIHISKCQMKSSNRMSYKHFN